MKAAEKILEAAASHLGSAVGQSIPADDQIIMGHVNAAYQQVRDALIVLRHDAHIHRAGVKDIDQCGLCGHDIRHEIHSRL